MRSKLVTHKKGYISSGPKQIRAWGEDEVRPRYKVHQTSSISSIREWLVDLEGLRLGPSVTIRFMDEFAGSRTVPRLTLCLSRRCEGHDSFRATLVDGEVIEWCGESGGWSCTGRFPCCTQ